MPAQIMTLECLAQSVSGAEVTYGLVSIFEEHGGWIVMGGVAVIAIVCGAITSVVRTRARERSRREIAAYIAEGAMTPEQGERLMAAGDKGCGS